MTSLSVIFFNPARLKCSAMNPGAEHLNNPGPSGCEGFSSNFEIIVSMDFEIHVFFSGTFHTAAEILPPGFSTLYISFNADCISGKNMKPQRQLIPSNKLSSKGRDETSQYTVSKL